MQRTVYRGRIFRLYRGERYFSRGTKRLHRVIWSDANGPIPSGYHVHHSNGNPLDNRLENLELLQSKAHAGCHRPTGERLRKLREHLDGIRDKAARWHRSKEGRRWHGENAIKIAAKRKKRRAVCSRCGGSYWSKAPKRFCSNACKSASRRADGRDRVSRQCQICGIGYYSCRFKPTETCGRSCGA